MSPPRTAVGRYVVRTAEGRETIVHAPYEIDGAGNELADLDAIYDLSGFPSGTHVTVFFEDNAIDSAYL